MGAGSGQPVVAREDPTLVEARERADLLVDAHRAGGERRHRAIRGREDEPVGARAALQAPPGIGRGARGAQQPVALPLRNNPSNVSASMLSRRTGARWARGRFTPGTPRWFVLKPGAPAVVAMKAVDKDLADHAARIVETGPDAADATLDGGRLRKRGANGSDGLIAAVSRSDPRWWAIMR